MSDVRIDAGPIALVDADSRGFVFYHVTGAVTVVPVHVLKEVLKSGK